MCIQRLPWWLSGKEAACNAGLHAGDTGLIPGSGSFPWRKAWHLLQCSCLENLMDRGVCWATVHGNTKSWTRLRQLSMHACVYKKLTHVVQQKLT